MRITHEKARQLIHFHADESLDPQEKSLLSTHLQGCFECRTYVEEIKEVERTLLPVMSRQWNRRPIPLSITGLKAKRDSNFLARHLLTMRTALISLVFVAFAFSAWQFTHSVQGPGVSPVNVLPIPTPSVESTSTTSSFKSCNMIGYTVQTDDTLASIAEQFSIPKDEIISINNLRTETVKTGMTLTIPACNFTPTVVVNPTRSITTLTPVISSATSSPEPNRY